MNIYNSAQQINSYASQFLQDALLYRHMGISVFPVGKDKKPLPGQSWRRFQRKRATDKQIGTLFSDNRVAGIAAIMGPISQGVVDRDFDCVPSYLEWAKRKPQLAAILPTSRTGRGFHVFCRLRQPIYAKWHDGELRGTEKQYVILPPSFHPNGGRYEWFGDVNPFGLSYFPMLSLDETGWIDAEHPLSSHHERNFKEAIPNQASKAEEASRTHIRYPNTALRNTNIHKDIREIVSDAILRTLPGGIGERNDRLFDFARILKSFPELAGCEPEELEVYVRQWHLKALPVIGTKDWGETWYAFQQAWQNVLFPMGSGILEEALRLAMANPLPAQVGKYRDEPTLKLWLVCRELQVLSRTDTFFLSARTAARLCGFTNLMTTSRRLKDFCALGILELVKRGSKGAEGKRTASYYQLCQSNHVLEHQPLRLADVSVS